MGLLITFLGVAVVLLAFIAFGCWQRSQVLAEVCKDAEDTIRKLEANVLHGKDVIKGMQQSMQQNAIQADEKLKKANEKVETFRSSNTDLRVKLVELQERREELERRLRGIHAYSAFGFDDAIKSEHDEPTV